jgi:hypothetical protein
VATTDGLADVMDRIGGQAWTVRGLFGRRHLVDVYQREYQWEKIHLQDLINDLARRYLAQRRPEHELQDVATFEPYFLGPIITHQRMDQIFIVDGQQRLTTLMLMLIWLHRLQTDRDDAVPGLETLFVSYQFGRPVFAVEDLVLPREPVLSALLHGREVRLDRALSTSETNIVARFTDLDELFPIDLQDDDLPFFIYWLLDRVILVEISTHDDRLALETFETMNDRGLRLNAADLLKSFLLQHANPANRAQISHVWRARVTQLTEADSNGHTTFMKNWLRAKYSRHAADDDAIGRGFDRWLRVHHEEFGLRYPGDFSSLVLNQIDRLAKRYMTLLDAARRPRPGLDPVYFNGLNSVTLQLPLILAAVTPDDDDATFTTKANMVAGFLDIVVTRRMVNDHDYRYDTLSHSVFALAREIRDMDPAPLAQRLGEEIAALPDGFEGVANYALRHGNRAKTKYLLSRLTAWLQVNVDPNPSPPAQAEVVQRLRAHEIEHVWANHSNYQPQVAARRFQAVRNRLGALVLLTKDVNAAIGDDPYKAKIEHYIAQNTLARSLHPLCYQANPRFLRLVETHKLPFQSFDVFDEAAIDQRQRLYRRLCELVWDPGQYGLVVPLRAPRRQTPDRTRVTVSRLRELGHIPAAAQLVGVHRGVQYRALLTPDGHFTVESGETFTSPSAAAAAVLERPSWPGWTFWRVTLPDGTTATLDAIRKTALQQPIAADER